MDVLIYTRPCRLTVQDKQGHIINRDDPGFGIGWEGKEVRCWKLLAPDEKFFGLGEKGGPLNKRGHQFEMWNSDHPHYTNDTDPLYQSIPFYIGIHNGVAYGIYFNNSYRTVFNMGAGNRRYAAFAAQGGVMDYVFIYGPEVGRVLTAYTELTGRMELPPLWALGYQQCRWSYFPDREVLTLARTFRDKAIPADVIYLDIHYMDGYRVFTWDPRRFPDPVGMLKELRNMGFRVVTIIDPGVKVDREYAVAREGVEENHFIKYPDGEVYVGEVWPGPAFFPDFSRPETRRWWGKYLGEMLRQGVAGFWNDMNEPAVWGQAFPVETILHDQGNFASMKKMHNLYALLMAQATHEAFRRHQPDRRPFILSRSGFAGLQRYAAVWTGDNTATWEHLELDIRMMLGLGLSGIPFVGMDIGGFEGTPTPEMYARWIEVGALAPLCRTHSMYNTPDQEPWSFGEEVEAISRKWITRRYELLPYLYTLFWEASESGVPIWRPLFWYDQQDEQTYEKAFQHQFYVGEKLLVAPVTRPGQTLQKVYLPKGKWLDWHTGAVYQGPGEITVDAPLDRLPLFLREGAVIPSQPPVQHTGEPRPRELIVDIFPAGDYGNFLLYEDDGESLSYRKGEYRLTELEFLREKNKWSFTRTVVHDQYHLPPRTLEVRLHAVEAPPRDVRLGRQSLPALPDFSKAQPGYIHDARRRLLIIQFLEAGTRQRVEIKF
ncbi:MAG: DUF5110 domain-containing protein [Calditrichaeota bacterium]|nr:MAG: DUF5110 domain-containing protein [Calditrichota bacterium]